MFFTDSGFFKYFLVTLLWREKYEYTGILKIAWTNNTLLFEKESNMKSLSITIK